ncbi:pyocin knob domain-containing protein [Thermus brockianus]
MPKRLTPEDRWETEFEVPVPNDPRRIGPLEVLFQRMLNRTERLKNRIAAILGLPWDATPPDTLAGLAGRVGTLESNQGGTTLSAHRTASVLDHPDGSVTTPKLADGAVTLAKLASAILGQPNGLPLLNSAGALAASDGYLSRGSVTSAVDWNTLTAAGVYEIASFGTGSANTPPAVTQQGHLLVLKTSGATTQVYVPKGDDPGIYWRQYAGGTWSTWATAGVMYGSNSNGSYIRFADGTQICWGINAGKGPDPQTITYPAAFSSPPAVIVTPSDWPAAHISVDSMWGYGTTQQKFRKYNADGSVYTGVAYGFDYIAIGRWK